MSTPEETRKLQNKDKQKLVLNALNLGCSLVAAAKLAGCSPTTIRREAELDPEFGEQYKKARGESEFNYMQLLSNAAAQPQYWRAAAWALERRFPKFYAPRSPDVVTLSQITILIAKIAQILEEEIPAPTLRKKVLKRLDTITIELRKEHPPLQPDALARTDISPSHPHPDASASTEPPPSPHRPEAPDQDPASPPL